MHLRLAFILESLPLEERADGLGNWFKADQDGDILLEVI